MQAFENLKAQLGGGGSGYKHPPPPPPKAEKDPHTGFYCTKCKMLQYPACYTLQTDRPAKGRVSSTCAECGTKLTRIHKVAKPKKG